MATSDTPLPMGHSTFMPDETAQPRRGFRLGFVLGILFGTLATLIFTPKTGEELREQIREVTIIFRERAIGVMTGERPYEPDSTA